MRRLLVPLLAPLLGALVWSSGCAHPVAALPPPEPEWSSPLSLNLGADGGVTQTVAPNQILVDGGVAQPPLVLAPDAGLSEPEEADDGDEDDTDDDSPEEADEREGTPGATDINRYTAELSDAELKAKWQKNPESLGSISMGFTDEGRLINGVQFPRGADWTVVSPEKTWGTQETVDYVIAAIQEVKRLHPDAPAIRVNQIGIKDGGYLRPHKSHQSGRDVDLGFYYPTESPIRTRDRYKYINLALNWDLVKALLREGDVQFILVDKRVQKVLYDFAVEHGEDKTWLNTLFHAGRHGAIQHARHHRDHFHVRFYNPRAQELGRRVAPLLALRPEQNVAFHRVRKGDTLGALARKYGSSVKTIQQANHLRGTALHLSQVLRVPQRGACTHCPVPPPMLLPPRHLSPADHVSQEPTTAGMDGKAAERAPPQTTKPAATEVGKAPAPDERATSSSGAQAPAARSPGSAPAGGVPANAPPTQTSKVPPSAR